MPMKRQAHTLLILCALMPVWSALMTTQTSAQSHHGGHHSFQDAAAWAKKFDDPKRDASQKPAEVIQALQLKLDAVVADIGAGTGYFAVKFARAVPQGRVYAVDAEPDMVKYLGERARQEGLGNLIPILAETAHPRVPEKADLIILVNTYHHIHKREIYFRELKSTLNPGGRLAIIDFRMDAPEGPSPKMRIAPQRVQNELAEAGYRLAQDLAFLPNQYCLIFEPAAR